MKKKGQSGMMYAHRRSCVLKKCRCTKCGIELTPSTACYYVDGCNFAITNSAKPYCKECYMQTFGRY